MYPCTRVRAHITRTYMHDPGCTPCVFVCEYVRVHLSINLGVCPDVVKTSIQVWSLGCVWSRDVGSHASVADRAIRISTADHCIMRVCASLTLRLPTALAIINLHCHGNQRICELCMATADVQTTGPDVTGPQRAFRPILSGRRCGLTIVSLPRSLQGTDRALLIFPNFPNFNTITAVMSLIC